MPPGIITTPPAKGETRTKTGTSFEKDKKRTHGRHRGKPTKEQTKNRKKNPGKTKKAGDMKADEDLNDSKENTAWGK